MKTITKIWFSPSDNTVFVAKTLEETLIKTYNSQ